LKGFPVIKMFSANFTNPIFLVYFNHELSFFFQLGAFRSTVSIHYMHCYKYSLTVSQCPSWIQIRANKSRKNLKLKLWTLKIVQV